MKLILIRGLPGSGKSTLAKEYVKKGFAHFEADMYFEDEKGNYNFNPKEIKNSHAWCKRSCGFSLSDRKNVVVSNTFTQKWEMDDYKQLAKEYGAELEIIEAKGNFQNVHGVPVEVIERMRSRWEEI